MGLFDQILGGGARPQHKPGLGDTVAMGVILALLVKAVRSHQAGQAAGGSGRSFDPAGAGGGLGGILGGLAGGGGLGGLLGSLRGGGVGGLLNGLGGSGALGALISRLQQGGLGQQASSWVSTGPNQGVAPQQLGSALGEDTLRDLEQHTGLSREDLLQQLSHLLPQAVDSATPDGRLPDDADLHAIAHRPQPS